MTITEQSTIPRVEETVAARCDGGFLSGTQPQGGGRQSLPSW